MKMLTAASQMISRNKCVKLLHLYIAYIYNNTLLYYSCIKLQYTNADVRLFLILLSLF